jgi:SAM-dependent methyltransferase
MNHLLHGVARAIAETFDLPGPILEIGAYQVDGQEGISNLRALFPDKPYIGVDMRAGPGVDCVANVESLPQPDASVGTVVALSTFEHVRCFWRGFEEIRRVLRPDGVFIVSCPFFFRIHNYPADYWRFTPAAFEALLESYPSKLIGWHGARHRPANVWAAAFREGRPPITPAEFTRYRALLDRYALEPRKSWTRKLRYRLAGLLCGRGPFAPYLDHDRWETVCTNLTDAAA